MSNTTETKQEITVCINETDLISRDFDDCERCALATAIKRKTGKYPLVDTSELSLYDDEDRRSVPVLYRLSPEFTHKDYLELRERALNREKVFHYIKLIPV